MYVPPAFKDDDIENIRATIKSARLATLVTSTADGLIATPLPLYLKEDEGEHGVIYGHVARGNAQWRLPPTAEALAIFSGAEAYVTPAWYQAKQETGKVVPTWNYVAVHAYGPVEFFQDPQRLLEAVTMLTNIYERPREEPWQVTDAPDDYVASQLKGIVGVRIPVTRYEGKRKMSQNRPEADRAAIARGLAESERPMDQFVSTLIPTAK